MAPEARDLDLLFGAGPGTSAAVRARASTRLFVRSIDSLGADDPLATGRRLNAREALEAYGYEKLLEVVFEGSATLAKTADAAGQPLRIRRNLLGLTARVVANRAGVTEAEVVACEESRRLPLRVYERIGRTLGLDEYQLGVSRDPVGNDKLAVRLRNVGEEGGALGPYAVSVLAEAAWVATTQIRLADALGLPFTARGLAADPNYGTSGYPAFKWGYRLAAAARTALSLAPGAAVPCMREIVEDTFGIPLIQCEIGESIAGATLEVDGGRAIIVNISGPNRLFYMRRATLAHELGHVLFDPAPRLERLRVDDYAELDRPVQQEADSVEQRANAFAVEFLAPGAQLVASYGTTGSLADTVAAYGLGPTATRHQLHNASNGAIDTQGQRLPIQGSDEWRRRFSDWEGREAFALDYPVIPNLRLSRAGRFSALVIRAAEERLVSWDTAAQWLETDTPTAQASREALKELFPRVWSTPSPA